jgi:hypothetical protein
MRTPPRGATAIVVAIVLAVMCGFVAISLDVGHLLSVRGELQNGADAAALAGAKRLDGTNDAFELALATSDARNYARNHLTDRYDVEPSTIELGAWVPPDRACSEFGGAQATATGPDGSKFCPIAARTSEAAADINAVRVVTTREGTPGATGGGAVELAFGAFVGHSEPSPVTAEAVAVSGGPCSQGCPDLPIAIRAGCLYDGGQIRCDGSGVGAVYYIGLSPAPADSAGLTSLSEDPASANRICGVLRRTPDCSEPLRSDEEIEIQNGTSWSSNCADGCSAREYNTPSAITSNDSICEVIRRKADADCDGAVDLDADGRPSHRGQVPVVLYAGETLTTCTPGDHYNKQGTIVGWATIAVVSARCESAGTSPNQLPFGSKPITALCDAYQQANGDFSGSTCVAIQLYCDEEDDEQSRVGCGWFGTAPLEPVLVR